MIQETVARLGISLNDIEPEIWRTVGVPLTGILKMLHDVMQAAIGWQEYHLWHFEVGDRRYGVLKAGPSRIVILHRIRAHPAARQTAQSDRGKLSR